MLQIIQGAIMEPNPELLQQLMALTGLTDVNELRNLVKEIAPLAAASKLDSRGGRKNNSPFQIHLVRMTALLESAGTDRFLSLNGDIPAQIRHVYAVLDADEYHDVRSVIRTKKSEGDLEKKEAIERSKTLRDSGNKLYQKKDFAAALVEYSQAVLTAQAASDGSRDISLALGNRSAVFFETGDHARCLADIEAALMFGYPKELRYKLHDRQGRCLALEKSWRRAREAFQNAINGAEDSAMKGGKKEEFVAVMLKAMRDIPPPAAAAESVVTTENPNLLTPCPFDIWDRHVNFPPLSDSLEIVFDDVVGRHVLARKPIRAGEAIVIEDPIVAHLSPRWMRSNCCHCHVRNGSSVLPSPLQRRATFCSMACLRSALESYHRVEARVDINDIFYGDSDEEVDNLELSGSISLAYRAMTQKDLDFFKAKRESLFTGHNIRFGTSVDKDFSYTGEQHYRGLYNLVTHYHQCSTQIRMTFMIRTFVLLKCLQASGYFPPEAQKSRGELTEDEAYIALLLFHFQSGIQYNLHTIYQVEGKIEATKKIPLVDIGAGVYPTTLFFNHSCSPNTVRINQGPRVIFVAKRNIFPGEEVTDCYGIHHLSMDKKSRSEALRTGYAFDCSCTGCGKDLPLLGDLPKDLPAKVAVKLGTMLTKYKSLFEEGKLDKALKICQDYLTKLEELGVAFPHRNYEIAAMALCSCLWGQV